MAKTFVSKRTPAGMAVMMDAIDNARKDLQRAEKRYGEAAKETAEPVLVLGFLYYLTGDYGEAERTLLRCLSVVKRTIGPDTREYLEGLALLFEVYVDRKPWGETARLVDELNSLSRKLGRFLHDPLAEALYHRVQPHNGGGTRDNREHAFALMTLCRCITRGHETYPWVPQLLGSVQQFFKPFGIGEDEWKWLVKHASLKKYDFVGLLSILLYHTGLAPRPLRPVFRRKPRIIEVR